eukprot:3881426-Rhodomonas_salina.2
MPRNVMRSLDAGARPAGVVRVQCGCDCDASDALRVGVQRNWGATRESETDASVTRCERGRGQTKEELEGERAKAKASADKLQATASVYGSRVSFCAHSCLVWPSELPQKRIHFPQECLHPCSYIPYSMAISGGQSPVSGGGADEGEGRAREDEGRAREDEGRAREDLRGPHQGQRRPTEGISQLPPRYLAQGSRACVPV